MADPVDTAAPNPTAQTAPSAQTPPVTGDNTPGTPDGADGAAPSTSGATPPAADASAPTSPNGATPPSPDGTPPPDGTTPPAGADGQQDPGIQLVPNPAPLSSTETAAIGGALGAGIGASRFRKLKTSAAKATAKAAQQAEARATSAQARATAEKALAERNVARDIREANNLRVKQGQARMTPAEEQELAASKRTAASQRKAFDAAERAEKLGDRSAERLVTATRAAEGVGREGLALGILRRAGPVAAVGVTAYDVYQGWKKGGTNGAIAAGVDDGKTLAGAWAGGELGAIGGAMIGGPPGALIGGIGGGILGAIFGKPGIDWLINKGPAFLSRHLGDPAKVVHQLDKAVAPLAGKPTPSAAVKPAPPATAPAHAAAAAAPAGASAGGHDPHGAARGAPARGAAANGGLGPHALAISHEQPPADKVAKLNDAQLQQALKAEKDLGLFEFDKATLTPEAQAAIKAQIDDIKKAGKIVLIGHTDPVGTSDYNQALSMARAEAVRQELIKDGISADNITVTGVGKTDLKDPNPDPAHPVSDPLDRRVTWATDPTISPTPAPAPTATAPATGPATTPTATGAAAKTPAASVGGIPGPYIVGGAAFAGGYFVGGGGFDGHHRDHGHTRDHDHPKDDCPPGMEGQPKHHWWQRPDQTSRPDRGGLRAYTANVTNQDLRNEDAPQSAPLGPIRGGGREGMTSGPNLTLGAGRGSIGQSRVTMGQIGSARFSGGGRSGGMGHGGGGGGHH